MQDSRPAEADPIRAAATPEPERVRMPIDVRSTSLVDGKHVRLESPSKMKIRQWKSARPRGVR